MSNEKTYTIGSKSYLQRPVVLMQLTQLIQVIPDTGNLMDIEGPDDVITFLGDALVEAMAIVLCPAGVALPDKDLDSIKTELNMAMDLPTAMEVIEDFFGFNQVSSLVERVGSLMTMMEDPGSAIGSRSGSASSPTETSQSES